MAGHRCTLSGHIMTGNPVKQSRYWFTCHCGPLFWGHLHIGDWQQQYHVYEGLAAGPLLLTPVRVWDVYLRELLVLVLRLESVCHLLRVSGDVSGWKLSFFPGGWWNCRFFVGSSCGCKFCPLIYNDTIYT